MFIGTLTIVIHADQTKCSAAWKQQLSNDEIKQHYNILKTLDRKNLLKTDINIDKLFKIKYHREFDEIFTIKLFNFESVDEYYKKSSCYLDVDKLKIPTFFINSMNDRLSPWDTLNLDLCI